MEERWRETLEEAVRAEIDVAWAAGLFEGEGSIFVSRRKKTGYRQLVIAMSMTDQDVVERFAEITGGRVLQMPPYGLGKKDQYRVTFHGPEAVRVLNAFHPWFGERRANKAKECIAEWENRPRKHSRNSNSDNGVFATSSSVGKEKVQSDEDESRV